MGFEPTEAFASPVFKIKLDPCADKHLADSWKLSAESLPNPFLPEAGLAAGTGTEVPHPVLPLISTGVAAEAMGQSTAMHSDVYGSWTDDCVSDDAFEAPALLMTTGTCCSLVPESAA